MKKSKVCAIIAAAGKGKRMKSCTDKQFLMLKGKTILERTVEKFENCEEIDGYVIVTGSEHIKEVSKLSKKNGWKKLLQVAEGGEERQNSVYKGLCSIDEDTDIVLIHDGVRPFVTNEEIIKMIHAAQGKRACVLASRVKDTIKVCNEAGHILSTPKRESLWAMQTPQAFKYDAIKTAYEMLSPFENVTDDAAVAEMAGIEVYVVEGGYNNIKITTPEDMVFAKAILKKEEKNENS